MMFRQHRALVPVALLLLAFSSCRTTSSRPFVTRDIQDVGSKNVKLVSVTGADGQLERFDHPVSFLDEDMLTVLGMFSVSRKGEKSWQEPQPLFDADEIRQLAHPIAEAFREAKATEFVAFKFTHVVSGFILPKHVVTAGTMYIRDNELHLRLEWYRQPAEDMGIITYQAGGHQADRTIRIQKGPHMRYVTPPGGRRPALHWVAVEWPDLQDSLAAKREERARIEAARKRAIEERHRGRPKPGGEGWETFDEGQPREDVYFPDEAPTPGT